MFAENYYKCYVVATGLCILKHVKKSVKNIFGFVLLVISFLLIFVFNVGTIWIILGSCILGVVLAGFRGEFKEQKEGEAK